MSPMRSRCASDAMLMSPQPTSRRASESSSSSPCKRITRALHVEDDDDVEVPSAAQLLQKSPGLSWRPWTGGCRTLNVSPTPQAAEILDCEVVCVCGIAFKVNADFCKRCGASREAAAAATRAEDVPLPSDEEDSAKSSCISDSNDVCVCGSIFKANSEFCRKCGSLRSYAVQVVQF